MGFDHHHAVHVGPSLLIGVGVSAKLIGRVATTSLIIARRIIASINGNPEFDAAKVSTTILYLHYETIQADHQMLRPYTYAYVCSTWDTWKSADSIAVHQCHYRYPPHRQYRLWTLALQDRLETYRQCHQADHGVCRSHFF
jgi:hypothetical protein